MLSEIVSEEKAKLIRDLLEKTESNLKEIQVVGKVFVYPTLDEWRAATIHVCRILCGDKTKEDIDYALIHLMRACADSCEILLTFHLEKAHKFFARYRRIMYHYAAKELLRKYEQIFIEALTSRFEVAQDETKQERLMSCINMRERFIRQFSYCEEQLHKSGLDLYLECDLRMYKRKRIFPLITFIVSVIVTGLIAFLNNWR